MSELSRFLRAVLKALFSEFNGVQVFFYPISIFYWLNKDSLVQAFSNLLTQRIHYLPLSFWGVLFIYILFIIMKSYTIYFQEPHKRRQHLVSDFWDSIIHLHIRLFIVLLIVMVFFVLAQFLSYFYGIKLPVKQAIALFFRLFTILIIIYYYISSMWLSVYRKRGYGDKRSEYLFFGWLRKNPFGALQYTVFLMLLVLLTVRLYVYVIAFIYDPLFLALKHYLGISVHLELVPLVNVAHVFYNLFILGAAFMLSNLFFYPLIYLTNIMAKHLHPIRIKTKVNYAQS